MNHISPDLLAQDAQPMTKRALSKMRTREALLAAARRLFAERGYEAATVRDIAAAAGLSTGAVFANFADKAQVFAEILDADARSLANALRQVSNLNTERPRERLAATLAAGYAFQLKHLPLFMAAVSQSWRHEPKDEAAQRLREQASRAVVEDILRDGARQGELCSGLDVELAGDLIWHAYLSNFRFAAYDGFDLSALTGRFERQLDLILGGLITGRTAGSVAA